MIRALPEVRQEIDENSTVIAQHGDEFIVTWTLGLRAQQKPPEDAQHQSTYWLLHGVVPSTLTPSMLVVMGEGDMCLALIKGEELSAWLDTLTGQEQSHLLTQNPHLKRHLRYDSVMDGQ
jgi:hypothetical protein